MSGNLKKRQRALTAVQQARLKRHRAEEERCAQFQSRVDAFLAEFSSEEKRRAFDGICALALEKVPLEEKTWQVCEFLSPTDGHMWGGEQTRLFGKTTMAKFQGADLVDPKDASGFTTLPKVFFFFNFLFLTMPFPSGLRLRLVQEVLPHRSRWGWVVRAQEVDG
jgi:hypothetical protein